jgi:hypothetical protein
VVVGANPTVSLTNPNHVAMAADGKRAMEDYLTGGLVPDGIVMTHRP